MSPPAATTTDAEMRALVERARQQVAAIPGVVAVAGVSNRPLLGVVGSDSPVWIEGQSLGAAEKNPFVNTETITPEYFHTLRTRLVGGRFFDEDDRATTAAVVIVSKGFSAWAWPDGQAVGKRLHLAALGNGQVRWWTVVGVVADARNRQITEPAFDVYAPFAQSPNRIDTLVVRTTAEKAAIVPAIRQRLRALNGNSVVSVEAMEDVVSEHQAPWRANLALFTAFAALTVLISVTGLYAMMAHTIVEQSREIGVRLVLGATPGRVAGGVIASALWVVAAGGLIGLGAAAAAGRLMGSLLFGVEPLDPATLFVSPLLLAAVALAACALPALRAARTDPAVCLRAE
jgi:predicted permease